MGREGNQLDIDRWITTDWRDDGFDCHDAGGTAYPEHDFPPEGEGRECRRDGCGAEIDE